STFAKVKYENVYPGVDLVYYGKQGELEYDFIVSPGADPKQIRLAWGGAQSVAVDDTGDLRLKWPDGDVLWRQPVIYQVVNGTRGQIAGGYVLRTGNQVGFEVDAYDASASLIIDPALVYATYLGGSSDDSIESIAVDASGNAYVTG